MPTRPALLTAALLLAASSPAAAQVLPGGDLRTPADLAGAPGPVGGIGADWQGIGEVAPTAAALPDGTPALRLAGNTTLMSPETLIPEGAQVLSVRARSAAGAVIGVTAAPVDGSAVVPLGEVLPDAAGTPAAVPVGAAAGRRVRFILDPTAPLGAVVDVSDVGPFSAPVPGWALTAGAPRRTGTPEEPRLRVADDEVALTSPATVLPGTVRRLLVSAHGPGVLRLEAGAGVRRVTLRGAWQDVAVPVPAAGPVQLRILAVPGDRPLTLRELGRYVHAVRVRLMRPGRRGGAPVVRGTLTPLGAGMGLRVMAGRRVVARTRARASGRFAVTVRTRARSLRLVVVGDRTRLGATVRLPRQLSTKRA